MWGRGRRKKGVNIISSSDETNRTFISTCVVCRVEGSEGGGQEKSVSRVVVVELPSQAFLGNEGADHDPGHQGHPRQQPLLETLLRPPALCRRILPKDFSKSFLADMKKKKERKGTGYLSGDWFASDYVRHIQMCKNPPGIL